MTSHEAPDVAVEPMTLHRRATDAGEPTNRELLETLEAFIAEHRRDHQSLDRRLAEHDTASALREARLTTLQAVAEDIRPLRDFKIQVETIGASVKWILGGSLLAAIASIAALIATFSHIIQAAPK